MRSQLTLLVVAFTSAAVGGQPPAWPQFRGPAGSGVAAESARPPTRIGPDANVKWKVAVPPGASSLVIAGDRLFLTGYEGGKLLTLAYRVSDGAELWRREAPAVKIEPVAKDEGTPPASTPATEGARLVVYFGSYGLICYDTAGKELWKYPLPTGETYLGFGTGSSTGAYASPVAANGHIYLCGRDGSVIVVRAGKVPERVSSAQVADRIAATPAIVGNSIYIRTLKTLYTFADGK